MNLKNFVLPLATLLIAGCGDDEGPIRDDGGGGGQNDGGVPATSGTVNRTVLVSDQTGFAANTDPNLINGWGLAFGPTGVAWVASNGAGTAQLYENTGAPFTALPSVTIPIPSGATGPSAPTGLIANPFTTALNGDVFLFSTEDGTIAGWKPANGTTAVLEIDNSAGADHPIYKGLAVAFPGSGVRLYAADFHNGKVDIWDGAFAPVSISGSFVDPALPAGYAPFNIQLIGDKLYVSYAKQDVDRVDDVAGVGNGFIDTYDLDGKSQARFVSGGVLNSPWGMVLAPSSYGNASNDILIGNFGDGHVNAYDPSSGSLTATFANPDGSVLVIDGLWALVFSPTASGATTPLYYTSGPAQETHGEFGRLDLQ